MLQALRFRSFSVIKDYLYYFGSASHMMLYGHHIVAIKNCDQAIKLDPNQSSIWNIKASALNKLGISDQAIICHKKAINLITTKYYMNSRDPNIIHLKCDIYLNYANTLHENKKYDLAEQEARNVIELTIPDDNVQNFTSIKKATELVGMSLLKMNKINESIKEFKKLCDLEDVYPTGGGLDQKIRPYILLADAYTKDNLLEKAYLEYDNCLNKTNLHSYENWQGKGTLATIKSECWNGKAIILRKQGKFQESIEAHNNAIEFATSVYRDIPELTIAYYNLSLGDTLIEAGRTKEALAVFEKVIALVPSNTLFYCKQARALVSLGRTIEAHQSCIKAEMFCNNLLKNFEEDEIEFIIDTIYEDFNSDAENHPIQYKDNNLDGFCSTYPNIDSLENTDKDLVGEG